MYAPNEKETKDTNNGIVPDTENNSENNESSSKNDTDEIQDLMEELKETIKKFNQTSSNSKNPEREKKKKKRKRIKRFIIFLIIVAILFPSIKTTFDTVKDLYNMESISYYEALNVLKSENITEVILVRETQTVYLYGNTTAEDGSNAEKSYSTVIPDIQEFTQEFNNIVNIDGKPELEVRNEDPYQTATISDIFPYIFWILIILIMVSFYRGLKKSMKELDGDSLRKAITGQGEEIKPVNTSNYSFDDVAGIDNERWEVEEVVEMLKNPKKYRRTGAKVPKGILLTGKPGTGKTLIAKAIAGESGVNFYSCAGSSFDEAFVGVGASKVRELFDVARKNAPSIIFIDEIDAVAKKRYSTTAYHEQTLNQLLSEMDGFVESDNVIFIAATNHPEALDPAITRPGRFDRIINIPLPNRKGRYEILLVHAKNKIFKSSSEKNEILQDLAAKTSGMSGATLENIINEASIVAVRNNRTYIDRDDVDEAFIKIILGISKQDKETSEKSIELTAYHEAGHAIIGRIKIPERKVLQVSIIPRGNAGGYTLFEDREEASFPNKNDFYNEILVDLGGRAAENYKYGAEYISVGASADLENANKRAHEMIYTYAMGNNSQMVRLYGEKDYNGMLEKEMYSEMKAILDKAYTEACEIIVDNKEVLETLATTLINERSTLNAEELEELFTKFDI